MSLTSCLQGALRRKRGASSAPRPRNRQRPTFRRGSHDSACSFDLSESTATARTSDSGGMGPEPRRSTPKYLTPRDSRSIASIADLRAEHSERRKCLQSGVPSCQSGEVGVAMLRRREHHESLARLPPYAVFPGDRRWQRRPRGVAQVPSGETTRAQPKTAWSTSGWRGSLPARTSSAGRHAGSSGDEQRRRERQGREPSGGVSQRIPPHGCPAPLPPGPGPESYHGAPGRTGLAGAGTRAGPQARAKASVPVSPAHMSLWLTSPHRVERCVAMNVSVT